MDLTPLVEDASVSPAAYTLAFIEKLRADVEARIRKVS
jgi:hypothetical protein